MPINEASRYDSAAGIDSFTIHTLWHVDETPAYDVRAHPSKRHLYIIVRTLDGAGELLFCDNRSVLCGPDTLIMLRYRDLLRYRCAAGRWHFWWLEGTCGAPDTLPLRALMMLPSSSLEREDFQWCFTTLGTGTANTRAQASLRLRARIAALLDAWQGHAQPSRTPREAIERSIARMKEQLSGIRMEQLAAAADLGPRRFRQVFARIMGVSPKRYYDSLRLEHSAGLLLNSTYSIAQIADRLGFCSPFHFSRAFTARYTCSPARYRRGRD